MLSLRVLFLATRDWYNPGTSGGDNTLWENARYLASAGHQVTFVAGSFKGAEHSQVLDGITVIRLGGIWSLWLRTFWYYMTLCRGKYDVVVAEGFGGSRIPRLAPLYVREPMITAWHQIHRDLFAAQYPKVLVGPLALLERITAWVHRDTKLQAYTEEWRDAFPQIGFKRENIFVVPVSIRENWLVEENGKRPSEPIILWIGKMRRYKCPDHVVRAMPDVIGRVPQARLIMAARHDDLVYERQLQQLVHDLGIDDRVEFRFNVTEVDRGSANAKRELFRNCRVMVLPSSVEGFGIVVLEANSCGVPVIASTGVPVGAVTHGKNGLRYQYGDIRALSDRIVEVLLDDDTHGRLSASSTEFARQFAWHRVSSQFEQVVLSAALSPAVKPPAAIK